MKIAIHNAQFSYYLGGTERAIYMQIKNLLKISKDIEITLLTRRTDKESILFKEIKNYQSDRFRIELFDDSDIDVEIEGDANSSCRWHLESMRFGLKTANFYKKNDFDFVISHFSTDLMHIPKKYKLILNIHGTPSLPSPLDENNLDIADHLIFTTKDIQSKISKMYPNTKNKKQKVIYLGTKITHKNCPTDERKNDILFVGRLMKIKGISTLITAVRNLKNKRRLRLIIVGNGPEEQNLKDLTKEYGLEKNITFLPYVSDQELFKLYKNSKIAVFPSYDKEGILLTMLEAASHGCGLIASDCCGMPEFIEDNKNGLLFEPKNDLSLSKKIQYLLDNEDERKKLGLCAFKKIINSWDQYEKTKELYNYYSEIKNG